MGYCAANNAGKLQEVRRQMDRHRWNIVRLCEIIWKNFGETTTEEGHKIFFSGKDEYDKNMPTLQTALLLVNTSI